jgi:hypothetical protein
MPSPNDPHASVHDCHAIRIPVAESATRSIPAQELQAGETCPCTLELVELLNGCVDELQRNTRRYARKQLSWIKNKLAPRCRTLPFPLIKLDSSDVTQWDARVNRPMQAIIEDLSKQIKGRPAGIVDISNSSEEGGSASDLKLQAALLKVQLSRAVLDMCLANGVIVLDATQEEMDDPANGGTGIVATDIQSWKKYTCDTCNGKVLNGQHEWNVHLKTSKHKKMARSKNKDKQRNDKANVAANSTATVTTTIASDTPASGSAALEAPGSEVAGVCEIDPAEMKSSSAQVPTQECSKVDGAAPYMKKQKTGE